ncbi:MAG TPA: choice-of-anchor E domain-containing protein [Puia sp.]
MPNIIVTRDPSLLQKIALALCSGMFLYFSSAGQTGSGNSVDQTVLSRTYDTLLAGNGYSNYTLSFSQWDPRLGKLVAIRIQTKAKVQYGFTLRNVDSQPDIYTITVGRKDTISSAAMTSPNNKIYTDTIGSYPLDSVNVQSVTPYTLLDNYISTDSITDHIASFVGNGKIIFTYSPVTWSNVASNNSSNYYYSAVIRDTTRFSVTYLYTTGISLGASMTRFTATREDPEMIQLGWTIVNETAGRQYGVQVHRDGQQFNEVDSLIPSEPGEGTADYQNIYKLSSGNVGKYYFRIKLVDSVGTVTYSDIREVTVAGELTGTGDPAVNVLKVYPNPATDFIHLAFNDRVERDWQVDILAADGHLLQRNIYFNTNLALVNFYHKLAKGVYFACVTDSNTFQRYVATFVIQ